MIRRREIRHVEWIDSAGCGGWTDLEEATESNVIVTCVSVGFLLREDPTQVVLALSVDDMHDNVSGVIAIPKVAVTKTSVLRKAQP